jgi:hypothetical protein
MHSAATERAVVWTSVWTEALATSSRLVPCTTMKRLVGAIGFESTVKRSFNTMQASGWHLRPWKAVMVQQTERR